MPNPPGTPSSGGTVDIFGQKVKKSTAAIGAVVVGGVLIIGYMRSRKDSAAATAAAANTATTAANTIDPATGLPAGSPQDEAALAGMQEGALGSYDSASYVGGQIIGYDQYGNPIYGSSAEGGTTPGSFTSNAAWAQAAEQYMGSTGSDAIAAALGKYITGGQISSDQLTIVQEAIAAEGQPPIAGTNGYPPNYYLIPDTSTTTTTTGTPPNVVGQTVSQALAAITAAGYSVGWTQRTGATGVRTAQVVDPSAYPNNTVLAQSITGNAVNLTISYP